MRSSMCELPCNKNMGKKTVIYTGGTFDLLHAGHMNFFRQVKELFPDCELVVALNTDAFVESYKKKKPIFSYAERKQHLEWCGLVDNIVENFGNEDSKPTISDVRPNIIAIGQDWLARNYCEQMKFDAQWLTDRGISLIYIPHTDGISTTEIKRRLK